mgnify:CR=1 FL=1
MPVSRAFPFAQSAPANFTGADVATTQWTVNQLSDQRENLLKEAAALIDQADTEHREATEAEDKRASECLASAEKLAKEIDKRQRLISAQTAMTTPEQRLTTTPRPDLAYTSHAGDTVPAPARRIGKLKSFTGPNADYNAYLSGMFMLAAVWRQRKAIDWCNYHGMQSLAMNESTNAAGGVLVPDVMENAIIDLRETYGVFRQNSRIRTMTSDTLTIPRRTGGLTVYFPGEGGTITASDKTFDAVTLVAKKMAAMTVFSSELNEDAVISIADDLAQEFAWALALKEDQIGFLGDGTSTYGGMNGLVLMNDGNHAASIYTAITGNTAFSTLDIDDFNGMSGKLPEYARPRAKWYISRPGFAASMERLMYAAGGNTVQTIGGGTGPSFLGYPVVIAQVMNSTLTAQTSTFGLCYFGDLALATSMGTRRGISVQQSEHLYFASDQIAIRCTERIDIVPHDLGDGSTAGPLIGLKTPSS